jgi:hypothetical protein
MAIKWGVIPIIVEICEILLYWVLVCGSVSLHFDGLLQKILV